MRAIPARPIGGIITNGRAMNIRYIIIWALLGVGLQAWLMLAGPPDKATIDKWAEATILGPMSGATTSR
jgi:hypothetical protein